MNNREKIEEDKAITKPKLSDKDVVRMLVLRCCFSEKKTALNTALFFV